MEKPYRYHLLPCAGPRCTPENGEAFKGALKDLLPDRKALGVRVSTTSCQGMCERGPNLTVYPDGVVYHRVSLADLPRIVSEHLRGGCPVREILERTRDEDLPGAWNGGPA
jgi:NADP-reducing hydrogenase subunit HndC